MKRALQGCVLSIVIVLCCGCQSGDKAEAFIKMVEAMPPEDRPADWPRTRALMARKPPAVGAPAPDFTLKTLGQDQSITLSTFHPDRPRVLIFGSYT